MAGRVLVAYGTKHGATAELAERIGTVLREQGVEADVFPAADVEDLSGYTAVVLGSGVYYGRWVRGATRFLKRWKGELERMPLWLFSSGPTGEGEAEELTAGWRFPKSIQPLLERLKPTDTALFKGKIDPERLGSLERAVVGKVKAPSGDYRDWKEVEGWAASIAGRVKGTER